MSNPTGDIIIKGARQHNLRNLELRLPRGKFIVFTGVSGSGKTSLVFDTLYAEGRRQYMESLSARSRQWLEQMDRPDVDYIQGLSPMIAVEQRSSRGANPRSTVATSTEIADYARLLWSLAGEQFCPRDGGRILRHSLDDCLAAVEALPAGTRLQILAPFMCARPSVLREELVRLQSRGFLRVRIGGVIRGLDDAALLPPGRDEVEVELVVDRFVVDASQHSRLADSLELAFREGRNRAIVLAEVPGHGDGVLKSRELRLGLDLCCERCGLAYGPLMPRHFSHNHPDGACEACGGLGRTLQFQPLLVVPDARLSLKDGAIKPWRLGSKRMISARNSLLRQLATQVPFLLEAPWGALPEETRQLLLHGDPARQFALKPYGKQKAIVAPFPGVLAELSETARSTSSESLRTRLLAYQTASTCQVCDGRRVNARAQAVKLGGINLTDFLGLTVDRAREFVRLLATSPAVVPAEDARRGLGERLGFLAKTGLGYLTLDREADTLSGGEVQRVRLATQLGLALVGVTYVLDEPSIGLHPSDHRRLLETLLDLRDRGNTLLVIEHDEDTIRAADELVEIGPGAGRQGGALVFQGSPARAMEATPDRPSRTGDFLAGRVAIKRDARALEPGARWLNVTAASENNLRALDVRFPVGLLTVVCGVSGSGKSTLVNDILANAAARRINGAKLIPGRHGGISGLEHFTGFVRVDQDPVGRSVRSNPATFTGIFDELRKLFAAAPLAKVRGYGQARFSFNVRGGRCERCAGEGQISLDMQFLGETLVSCPSCHGARYNRETLEVRYRGLDIAGVLALTITEALAFFRHHPKLQQRLATLDEVGLGYLQLGQPASTLSGGEAQRLKLSLELSRRQQGETLYILDEPTTGLHWDDIQRLLDLLFRLRDGGNTLIIIEHHRDVVRLADWLIELGPGAGEAGGRILFEGFPAELIRRRDTPTGKFL
ncbi:MAG: excinuclease ABC subunit UvrA [Puniceicoccales bacterium]|jgi:excinuclease ABC subunit A|nr:excinuclease ABC subunit UvrA [Puniceicoccales bacterium]